MQIYLELEKIILNQQNFVQGVIHTEWVLSVCLKGNEQAEEDGHLSFFVTWVYKLSSGSSVDAMLRFFLYDQLNDTYLIVSDVREKRFFSWKDTWGVSRVLPVSTFTDTANEFLVDDRCVLFKMKFSLYPRRRKTSHCIWC